MVELLCPKCHQPLVLPEETAMFDFIYASRVKCTKCGASVIIEDNVPRLRREGEPE